MYDTDDIVGGFAFECMSAARATKRDSYESVVTFHYSTCDAQSTTPLVSGTSGSYQCSWCQMSTWWPLTYVRFSVYLDQFSSVQFSDVNFSELVWVTYLLPVVYAVDRLILREARASENRRKWTYHCEGCDGFKDADTSSW